MTDEPRIRVMTDGPLLVSAVPLSRVVKGEPTGDGPPRWTIERVEGVADAYALCRCGGSGAMPLCDRWPERPCFREAPAPSEQPPVFTWRRPDGIEGPVVALKTGGPVRVGGGVPIEREDGSPIDPGDRVSLCRCGQSGAMPLCDGTHKLVGFRG